MISRPPKLSSVRAISLLGNSGSVTSPTTRIDLPPALRMDVVTSSAGAGSRSLTTTAAPSEANKLAAAAPMPRPDPVIIATLPSSMPMHPISFRYVSLSRDVAGPLQTYQPPLRLHSGLLPAPCLRCDLRHLPHTFS